MANEMQKKGYLESEFKLFHLVDDKLRIFEYHYHDFYKLLIPLRGNVSYFIEGKEYVLKPYDTLLLSPGELHKPIILDNSPYERIIFYISAEYFSGTMDGVYNLNQCFVQAQEKQSNLIRQKSPSPKLQSIVQELLLSLSEEDFSQTLFQKIKITEYLIWLNRILLKDTKTFTSAATANPTVLKIISFINEHIAEDLSIEIIAAALFLHPSYIMHLFKAETNYTIGKYITEKRLYLCNHYIREGLSVTEACFRSGFNSYGAFYHAYRKRYGKSPKKVV